MQKYGVILTKPLASSIIKRVAEQSSRWIDRQEDNPWHTR
jgi:hypothetical protein